MTIDAQSIDAMSPSAQARAVASRLQQLLPDIFSEVGSNIEEAESTIDSNGISMAELVVRTALALQREFGDCVSVGQVIRQVQGDLIEVFFEYSDPTLGLSAGAESVSLIASTMLDQTAPVE